MNKMMKIAAAGALMLLAACGKDDEPAPPPSQDEQYTVYVAGSYLLENGGDEVGCYWIDGVLHTLSVPDGSEFVTAEAVEVYNGSVYVFGTYDMGDGWIGGLWKDGILVDLNIDPERNSLDAFTISDGSLCFGGYTLVDNAVMPCCWIDGVQRIYDEPTDEFESRITEIAVSGDKVYMGGQYWIGNTGRTKVCYWNDGQFTLLGEEGSMDVTEANGLVMSNGRVCVLGWKSGNKAQLWIDDNLREYEFPQGVSEAFPQSLCAAPDGSIYILGEYEDPSGVPYACWWDEAGNRTDLESVYQAVDIAAAGGSIYIAGFSDYNVPCYWKDGVRFDLPLPGEAQDMEIAGIRVVKK